MAKLTKCKYTQKTRGTGSSKIKKLVMRDISKECGEGRFYVRNYIGVEYLVLRLRMFETELFTLELNTY